MLTESRRRYIAATHHRSALEIKQEQRDRLLRLTQDLFKDKAGKLRVLTLPGPWLHFERTLLDQAMPTWGLRYAMFEHNQDIFKLLAAKMAVRADRVYPFREENIDCPAIKIDLNSRHRMTAMCVNVQEYLLTTKHQYHVIWLDFCGPLITSTMSALERLPEVTPQGPCIFALTVMLARESLEVTKLIDRHADGDRMRFLKSYFLPSMPGASVVYAERYIERSAPMAHIVLAREKESEAMS